MTDTDITATDSTSGAQQQNLSALRLPELRQIAQRMGIRGTSTLRKGALIEAIQSNGASLAKPARETASEAVEAAGTTEPTKAPTRRRATKRVAAASDDAASSSSASDAAAAADEASTNAPAESSNTGDGEEVRYESRSAARRARRNRARMNQREQRATTMLAKTATATINRTAASSAITAMMTGMIVVGAATTAVNGHAVAGTTVMTMRCGRTMFCRTLPASWTLWTTMSLSYVPLGTSPAPPMCL